MVLVPYEGRQAACSFFLLSTRWRDSGMVSMCNLEEGSHQNCIILAPSSQTSSLQNCKKQISLCISHPVYGILL